MLHSYMYHLPNERIAQEPARPRDSSRLMLVSGGTVEHLVFREIESVLRAGDLLVMNNSRVIPAKLSGKKESTGGAADLLLVRHLYPSVWEALLSCKRPRPGTNIIVSGHRIRVLRHLREGLFVVYVGSGDPQGDEGLCGEGPVHLDSVIEERLGQHLGFPAPEGLSPHDRALLSCGESPVPPYVREPPAPASYQTVYAQEPGSVAAPTAGFHFTDELLERLRRKGVNTAFLTLHVGPGTFVPVRTTEISSHTMHSEFFQVPGDVVEAIARTHERGGRVILVGTTTLRALESVYRRFGEIRPFSGTTDLFLHPNNPPRMPFSGLLTNFHLPGSTLIMLVASILGRSRTMALYNLALRTGYRFYSFGDAMLLLRP